MSKLLELVLHTNARIQEASGIRWLGWAIAAVVLSIPAVALYMFLNKQERAAALEVEKALSMEERASMRSGHLAIGRAQESLHKQAELKHAREAIVSKKMDTDANYQAMADRIDNAKTFRDLKKIRDDLNKR